MGAIEATNSECTIGKKVLQILTSSEQILNLFILLETKKGRGEQVEMVKKKEKVFLR